MAAFKVTRRPTFRVNTLKATDDAVMARLREDAIQFERVKGIPHAFFAKNISDNKLLEHPLTIDGHIYLQGLTSMLPPLIMDPKPGETVLDLCAAPGSKTSQIAALMENRGTFFACEEDEIRYQKLLNTLRIQGANMVNSQHIDATLLHHEMPEKFDKILADVPCSAEGRVDLSQPRTFRYWSEKNIVAHAKLQRRLLRSAIGCLKPGGTLIYSTCTLAPEENENMIAWLVAEYPFMRPQPVTLPFPTRTSSNKTATLLPSKDYEGFFVAKLTKST